MEEITQSSLKGKPPNWICVCFRLVLIFLPISLSLWVKFQEKLGKHH